jgi:hypothetical protein
MRLPLTRKTDYASPQRGIVAMPAAPPHPTEEQAFTRQKDIVRPEKAKLTVSLFSVSEGRRG